MSNWSYYVEGFGLKEEDKRFFDEAIGEFDWEAYYAEIYYYSAPPLFEEGDEPMMDWQWYIDYFDLRDEDKKHFDEEAGNFDWVAYYKLNPDEDVMVDVEVVEEEQ